MHSTYLFFCQGNKNKKKTLKYRVFLNHFRLLGLSSTTFTIAKIGNKVKRYPQKI